jgi:allantoin racemase
MLAALQARVSSAEEGSPWAGPDAVIIGCFGDPGLAAARELLECPVVGPFESSIHLAAQLGAKAGVVTVLESVVPVLEQLVRGMGLSLRYAGAAAVEIPVLDLARNRATAASRATETAEWLIRTRDADVLILGCMSLSFLGIAEELQDRTGVPVINPAKCALKTAESLAAQGLLQSRRTYHKPRKRVGVP